MQFTYEPQAPTSAGSATCGGTGFASISAVTAALVRASDEAPSTAAAAASSAVATDTDVVSAEDTDSQSQTSADTLVDELVSAAAAAATNAAASESTIQLEDIASEAARQHGIN